MQSIAAQRDIIICDQTRLLWLKLQSTDVRYPGNMSVLWNWKLVKNRSNRSSVVFAPCAIIIVTLICTVMEILLSTALNLLPIYDLFFLKFHSHCLRNQQQLERYFLALLVETFESMEFPGVVGSGVTWSVFWVCKSRCNLILL